MQPKITITTSNSQTDPDDVIIEEIALPPIETWPDEVKADASPAVMPLVPRQETIALQFVGRSHERAVPLKHPFVFAGEQVDVITVKRLTMGQLSDVRQGDLANFGYFDLYSLMTGFPVAVLRGLIDEDGDVVTDVAYDFLPRSFKAESA